MVFWSDFLFQNPKLTPHVLNQQLSFVSDPCYRKWVVIESQFVNLGLPPRSFLSWKYQTDNLYLTRIILLDLLTYFITPWFVNQLQTRSWDRFPKPVWRPWPGISCWRVSPPPPPPLLSLSPAFWVRFSQKAVVLIWLGDVRWMFDKVCSRPPTLTYLRSRDRALL